jgi:hypothetical protein
MDRVGSGRSFGAAAFAPVQLAPTQARLAGSAAAAASSAGSSRNAAAAMLRGRSRRQQPAADAGSIRVIATTSNPLARGLEAAGRRATRSGSDDSAGPNQRAAVAPLSVGTTPRRESRIGAASAAFLGAISGLVAASKAETGAQVGDE